MARKIGIIAEDLSDVEVLKTLGHKVSKKKFSVSHFVGKGCGPLAKKTPGWCKSLMTKGCTSVLLVHDRDRNNAVDLRRKLEKILEDVPQQVTSVVIPIEELEAWLLSDSDAISSALNLQQPIREIHHPERIDSPKEYVGKEVWRVSGKRVQYVNTVHNGMIAALVDVEKIRAKCPSFAGFSDFFN